MFSIYLLYHLCTLYIACFIIIIRYHHSDKLNYNIGGIRTGNHQFSPDTNITREQMAVIMANYAKKLGYDLPAAQGWMKGGRGKKPLPPFKRAISGFI